MAITHAFVSAKADGADATLVRPSDWNAAHTVTNTILADGTVPLTANWDVGSFELRAQTLQSDVATGTAPLIVASTTVVTNLNADQLDGNHSTAFAIAAKGVTNGDAHNHVGGDGAQIDHTTCSNIGTNTHAQIDTHISSTVGHNATISFPVRSAGTVYQNTSGKALFVLININDPSAEITGHVDCDASNPPTTEIATIFLDDPGNQAAPIFFIVQNNHYYKLTTTFTVAKWSEWT